MENEWLTRVVLVITMGGTGLLIMWMARAAAAGRLKRNSVIGIRIPSVMSSDEAWLAGHKAAKRPTFYAGVASFVSGVIALIPLPLPAIVVVVLLASALMVGFVLYAAHLANKAVAALGTPQRATHSPR